MPVTVHRAVYRRAADRISRSKSVTLTPKSNHLVPTFLKGLMTCVRSLATLLVTLLFISSSVYGCSWDYPIWQIRTKGADALYRFVKGDKAGYIDRSGKVVVKPTLDFYGNYGDEFRDGLLLDGVASGPYINTSGKIVLDTGLDRNWEFSDGLAAAMREGENKWGYIDKTGKFAIEPKFESYPNGYVGSFSDGLARIQVDAKHGFIDRRGDFVIAPQFVFADDFNEGFAKVAVSGPCRFWDPDNPCPGSDVYGSRDDKPDYPECKFAFVDKSGKLLAEQDFENARDFSEGLAAVQKNGKWGFIDKQGKLVIPYQFDRAYSFSDGLARVGKDKDGKSWSFTWGYIDKSGRLSIGYHFERSEEFSDGLAPVGTFDEATRNWGNYYYVNKRGLRAFPGTFVEASHYYKGVAHVMLSRSDTERVFAYIDVNGRQIFKYKVTDDDD